MRLCYDTNVSEPGETPLGYIGFHDATQTPRRAREEAGGWCCGCVAAAVARRRRCWFSCYPFRLPKALGAAAARAVRAAGVVNERFGKEQEGTRCAGRGPSGPRLQPPLFPSQPTPEQFFRCPGGVPSLWALTSGGFAFRFQPTCIYYYFFPGFFPPPHNFLALPGTESGV